MQYCCLMANTLNSSLRSLFEPCLESVFVFLCKILSLSYCLSPPRSITSGRGWGATLCIGLASHPGGSGITPVQSLPCRGRVKRLEPFFSPSHSQHFPCASFVLSPWPLNCQPIIMVASAEESSGHAMPLVLMFLSIIYE